MSDTKDPVAANLSGAFQRAREWAERMVNRDWANRVAWTAGSLIETESAEWRNLGSAVQSALDSLDAAGRVKAEAAIRASNVWDAMRRVRVGHGGGVDQPWCELEQTLSQFILAQTDRVNRAEVKAADAADMVRFRDRYRDSLAATLTALGGTDGWGTLYPVDAPCTGFYDRDVPVLAKAVRADRERLWTECEQYRRVVQDGVRLPAPELNQDPAYAAFTLGGLEQRVRNLEADRSRLLVLLKEFVDEGGGALGEPGRLTVGPIFVPLSTFEAARDRLGYRDWDPTKPPGVIDARDDDPDPAANLARRVEELEEAIRTHRSQKADDRCIEDDDRLYAVLGDGIKCDRRVGDPLAMVRNCVRFIANRCEGGGWTSYAELEAKLAAAERDARLAVESLTRLTLEAVERNDLVVRMRVILKGILDFWDEKGVAQASMRAVAESLLRQSEAARPPDDGAGNPETLMSGGPGASFYAK